MACCNFNWNIDVVKCLSPLCPMLSRPKSGIEKLEKEMGKLKSKRDDIKNRIIDAKGEGKIPTNEVNHWLGEVETLEGQVDAIKQHFQSMSRFSCYYCCSINRRTAEKLGVANELMSQALDPIVIDLRMPNSSITELEKEMARLRCKRDDIKNQIDEAEREGKIQTNEVRRWLREVEMLEGQVIDIEQDFLRAAEKLSEAKELMNRAGALDSIARVGPQEPIMMLPISHRPPVGIESYVKDIMDYIDGGESKIIGIFGMGGVGKTTILNSIQRHYLEHSKFDCVISVVASKDCQLKRLQMDIAKSLGLKKLESDDQDICDKLFRHLKDKNCLLLLDDIWERLDLRLLGMAHPATEKGQQKQKLKVVVLTTRNETVCGLMKAEKIKVKCLNPDQAWQLFEQKCEKDVLSSEAGIQRFAHELVKECAGLPLALVTVAGAMIGKKSYEAGKDALHQIRDKHEWTTIGIPEDLLVMYKVFKLSYDSLENDYIRECLLCCALWREDYEINKFEELIPCWIGCGIIREFNKINEAFTKGCSYLDALMAASLLEHSSKQEYEDREKHVKMHDVIRDMALLMVSRLEGNRRKWIVKAGIGLKHLPSQEEWQEVERASFMGNQNTPLSEFGASTFPKLSMLILRGNQTLKTIPPSLFLSIPNLTYFDIARCRITELPEQICSLTKLEYLDLSYNPITTLPDKFGCLNKLEMLLLSFTAIAHVPNGIIANLSKLKFLDIREISSSVDDWLNELKNFKGDRQLSVRIDIDATTSNIARLNMLPNVFIWDLAICGDNDASKLSDLTKNGDDKLNFSKPQWCDNDISDDLESLKINFVTAVKLIFAKSRFRSLKILQLYGLQQLEEISFNGVKLNSLRELNILGCNELKDVSWVLQLPCLNLLTIDMCLRMEKLISDTGNSNSSIKNLTLRNLPELTCIANDYSLRFPYLEYIRVEGCSKLNKLSFIHEIWKSKLKEIRGDETWWHNLEWDDYDYYKEFLTCRFIATR